MPRRLCYPRTIGEQATAAARANTIMRRAATPATRAADSGVERIVVRNHGGCVEDSRRATIDALPEILQAEVGRLPVPVDSGFE